LAPPLCRVFPDLLGWTSLVEARILALVWLWSKQMFTTGVNVSKSREDLAGRDREFMKPDQIGFANVDEMH